MTGLVGVGLVIVMVFGGYMLAGGHILVIMEALPFELIIIGGAAIGAFMISNDRANILNACRDMPKAFRGVMWKADDYQDLLCLLYELIRLAKGSPVVLEEHVENPHGSAIFQRYPRILADHVAVSLICDTLRAASMNYDDPHQVEEVLDKRVEVQLRDSLHTSHALQVMADGLPALGIVAAVLGVIKTMGAIDQPPELLGRMIGGALVGTFIGVFLAYGLVGPVATRLKSIADEDSHFYQLMREVLLANLHRNPANICIEVGRQGVPARFRPEFSDLETRLRSLKPEAA